MALFEEHLKAGVITSVIISFLIYYYNPLFIDISISIILLYIPVHIIGSIFPDIDSNTSKPRKYLTYISVIISIIISYIFTKHYTLLKNQTTNLILTSIVLIIISIILLKLLDKIIKHRGILHNLKFYTIITIITVLILINIEKQNISILPIAFLTGVTTHITLDKSKTIEKIFKKI